MSELKPCPICGGANIEEGIGGDEMYWDMGRCVTCNSQFPVARRNSRPIEEALTAEIERLREYLNAIIDDHECNDTEGVWSLIAGAKKYLKEKP